MINKVQPSAIDLEKAVLGAILIEKEAIYKIADLLKPEMFYHDLHRTIFSGMLECMGKSHPIDLVYFPKHMEDKGYKIEPYTYTELTNAVVSSAHITSHARKVVETYLKREQIRIAGELLSSAYDGTTDAFEILETAEKQLHDLNLVGETSEAVNIDTVLIEVVKELETLRHRENDLTGVTTGHATLDRLTMGWQDTDLIIIAARPAVGKTAFTLTLALQAALKGVPVSFSSLEMSRKQLVKRVLASQSKMYLSTIKRARMSDEQMQHLYYHGIQPLSGIPLYIDDTATMSVLQLKARLRRLKRMYGIRIAFVDYLQLLKSGARKGANRHEVIGDISRELKIAAKELDMPIIALSQLNREADGKVPQLSNLKESGDIEQDADIVGFLYGQPESLIKQDLSLENDIFFKLAKHRNGPLSTIKFLYDKDYQTFTDAGEGEMKTNGYHSSTEDPF